MIWFAIALVVALAIGVAEARVMKDWFSGVFVFFGSAVVGGLVASIVSLLVGDFVYDKEPDQFTFDVKAAKDGSALEGRFSIFGGYINDEAYYFYYREYGDGSIKQGKIAADRTVIYEDQETRSYIEVTKYGQDLRLWGFNPGGDTTYEIHVPSGSVKQEVEFDLE